MDNTESLIQNYLEDLFGEKPIYEPKGNRPPDFEINGIGIEARLFNYHFFDENGIGKSLESMDIALFDCTQEVLDTFNTKETTPYYYLTIFYHRPFSNYYKYKKDLKSRLNELIKKHPFKEETIIVNDSITIRFESTPGKKRGLFQIGQLWDRDKILFSVPAFSQNLEYIIYEKAQKIREYKEDYDEWWLILNHHKFPSFDLYDQMVIESFKFDPLDFNRVIVLNKILEEIIELS